MSSRVPRRGRLSGPRLLLFVTHQGYSFARQAEGLARGFQLLNVPCVVLLATQPPGLRALVRTFRPTAVISIGSWRDIPTIVWKPRALGLRTIPWLVSDAAVGRYVGTLNRLPFFVTPSQYSRGVFVRAGVAAGRLRVIPEAVDPTFWRPLAARRVREFLELLSIPYGPYYPYDLARRRAEGVPVLLTIGGDATSKGALEVLAALGKLPRRIPWLYIIKAMPGLHSLRFALKELGLAQKFGIRDRIRYIIGSFSPVFIRGLMNVCDIYAAPSRANETFGLPLVEAQLCGRPVITTSASAAGETVERGQTGLVVPPARGGPRRADVALLGVALKRLLTDAGLRRRLSARARPHALQRYHPRVVASAFLDALAL